MSKSMIPQRFARFGITGAVCFLVGLGLLYVLTDLYAIHYLMSMSLAFVVVSTLGWFANRVWTFRSTAQRRSEEWSRYLTVNAAALCLTLGSMFVLVDKLGIHYVLASVLCGAAMTVVNYFAHRHFTFLAPEESRVPPRS